MRRETPPVFVLSPVLNTEERMPPMESADATHRGRPAAFHPSRSSRDVKEVETVLCARSS